MQTKALLGGGVALQIRYPLPPPPPAPIQLNFARKVRKRISLAHIATDSLFAQGNFYSAGSWHSHRTIGQFLVPANSCSKNG